jgi:SNF2 family DNA or RNA helicase
MTTLRPDQEAARAIAVSRPATLLAGAMGTGKSAIAIAVHDTTRCRRTLILCPTTVRGVWRREIAKHSTSGAVAVILESGSIRKRTAVASQAVRAQVFQARVQPVIIVINYEGAWRSPFRELALSVEWDLVVLDESQRVQRRGKIATFCALLHDRATRRLCLTGTPLTQDPLTVWAQCRFLDPSVFGENLEAFTRRYHNRYAVAARKACMKWRDLWEKWELWRNLAPTLPTKLQHPWAFPDFMLAGTIHTDRYLDRLARVTVRIEASVLTLPPLTVECRTFTMSKAARTLHDAIRSPRIREIATGLWANLRDSYGCVMRLQQITSGWLPDATGEVVALDHGKADCLEDILTEAGGEPVVVFTRFVHDLDIVRAMARRMGLLYGEISHRRKDGLSNQGTMTDHLQVLGVQEQAGGAGIDLTRARIAVFYSLSWSRADFDQAVARVHRPPATRPVIVYQLVADDSIDEEIYRAVEARRAIIGYVWKGLAAHALTESVLWPGSGVLIASASPPPW